MTNPKCAACGHVNRLGAAVCEMCDTHLGDAARPGAADPFRTTGESSDAFAGGFHSDGEEPRAGALPTDIPSPQFIVVGDVIRPTLEVYRKHFLLIGLLVLVTTLPQAILQYGAYNVFGGATFEGGGGGPGLGGVAFGFGGLGTLLYWLLVLLGNALLSGALAYAVVEIQRTGAARVGESLRWGLAKILKVAAVTLITHLLIYGLPAVVAVTLASILGPVVLIGFLLMLLPWVIMMLTFSLAVPAAAVENRGVIESLKRSAELTKGYKGLIFLTYFLWWLVTMILKVIVTWSFYYGGRGATSLPSFLVQTVIGGMLNASMFVLTVYIFFGILNGSRQGFGTRTFTPGP